MLQLCESLALSPLMMGIHLSDNGINTDGDYLLAVLGIFGIEKETTPRDGEDDDKSKGKSKDSGPECSEAEQAQAQGRPLSDPRELQKRLAKYYFKQEVHEHMDDQDQQDNLPKGRKEEETQNDLVTDRRHSIKTKKREYYKTHVMFGNELENLKSRRALNRSKHKGGVGRESESLIDWFTITRVLNHPELIFN